MSGFWGLVSASPLFGGITPLKVQLTPGCQVGVGADGGLAWCLSHTWLHLAPGLHLAGTPGLLVSHLAARLVLVLMVALVFISPSSLAVAPASWVWKR